MNDDDATRGDAGRALDGKVIDRRGEPVAKADVWLFREGGREGRTETDDAGRFRLALGDAADPWPAGDYVLRVLPPEVKLDAERTVAVPHAGSPAPQVVEVPSRRDVSALAGWLFLLLLCTLLVLASWAYLDMHGVTLDKLRARQTIGAVRTTALSEPLADSLEVARRQLAAAGALPATGVDDSLTTAEEIFGRVEQSQAGLLDEGRVMLIRSLFAQARQALLADDAERLGTALDTLLDQVESTRASFLWEENPGRLLEVMFWALLATLLRLIFNAGQYLYGGTFLKSAIPQHLAFLFTVPVVAVIIALVLMVVRIDAAGDTGVLLDMSNVLVSIILGALIGLAPWRAWEFLRSLADRVFERLAAWAKGGGGAAGAGEGDGKDGGANGGAQGSGEAS